MSPTVPPTSSTQAFTFAKACSICFSASFGNSPVARSVPESAEEKITLPTRVTVGKGCLCMGLPLGCAPWRCFMVRSQLFCCGSKQNRTSRLFLPDAVYFAILGTRHINGGRHVQGQESLRRSRSYLDAAAFSRRGDES